MSSSCENLRNVALAGHNGTGKTALNEAILYCANVISKKETVESGKTVSDFTDEEVSKGISIHTSASFFKLDGITVNLLDMPGTADFVGECVCGFRSCEMAIMLVDSKIGPQIETFKLWRRLNNRNKPRMVFVSKMDSQDADFDGVLAKMREDFDCTFLPFSLPIIQDGKLSGTYDLLHDKAYSCAEGRKEKEMPVPDALKAKRDEIWQQMVETAAEGDDVLMERFFEEGTLSQDDVVAGLMKGFSANSFVPVMAGSANLNAGIAPLLDFLREIAPNPQGKRDYKLDEDGGRTDAFISEEGLFTGYVFKTVIDQFSGKLSYVKVVTGRLWPDTEYSSSLSSKKEKPGKLYKPIGKKLVEVAELSTGDIGVIAKSQSLETNASLYSSSLQNPTIYAPLLFPSPTYSLALVVANKQDEVKITELLKRTCAEDLTFRLEFNAETSETIIRGMGEIQIGMILERIREKLKISVQTKLPEIAYRETITKSVPLTEYTHKKQTGGHGQFARVVIQVDPLARGEYYKFENVIKGGAVSKGYVPGIEKGLHDAMQDGFLAHYPLMDIGITLIDGKEHPVDSSEMAFRLAASGALKAALSKAGAVLLEPFSKVWIYADETYMGDILSDISTRRGRVISDDSLGGGMRKIYAEFPDASLRDYSIALKSITSGTASFDTEPSHYEILQGKLADDVIASRSKAAAS